MLDSVSVSVPAGGVVAVVGESGSGKSTLVRAALGLLGPAGRVTSGGVWYDGRDLTALPERDMARVRGAQEALMAQDPRAAFSPVRRLGPQFYEAMRHAGRVTRAQARERSCALLRTAGLDEPERVLDGYAFELSGGMCQRAALALALAQGPRLLLADEPTSALDVLAQAHVVDELARLRRELGMAVLLVTHSLGVAFGLADAIVVMYAGQVVERGSAAQLRERPLHPYTRALMAAVPRLGAREVHGIPGAAPLPGAYPTGCRFAQRCPLCGPACHELRYKLEDAGGGHETACPFARGDAARLAELGPNTRLDGATCLPVRAGEGGAR